MYCLPFFPYRTLRQTPVSFGCQHGPPSIPYPRCPLGLHDPATGSAAAGGSATDGTATGGPATDGTATGIQQLSYSLIPHG